MGLENDAQPQPLDVLRRAGQIMTEFTSNVVSAGFVSGATAQGVDPDPVDLGDPVSKVGLSMRCGLLFSSSLITAKLLPKY